MTAYITIKMRERANKIVVVGELGHGGALAARDNEGIDGLQLLRFPNLHTLLSYPSQCCQRQTNP